MTLPLSTMLFAAGGDGPLRDPSTLSFGALRALPTPPIAPARSGFAELLDAAAEEAEGGTTGWQPAPLWMEAPPLALPPGHAEGGFPAGAPLQTALALPLTPTTEPLMSAAPVMSAEPTMPTTMSATMPPEPKMSTTTPMGETSVGPSGPLPQLGPESTNAPVAPQSAPTPESAPGAAEARPIPSRTVPFTAEASLEALLAPLPSPASPVVPPSARPRVFAKKMADPAVGAGPEVTEGVSDLPTDAVSDAPVTFEGPPGDAVRAVPPRPESAPRTNPIPDAVASADVASVPADEMMPEADVTVRPDLTVRVEVDADLAVEVRPRERGVDVLLDGTADALEPLANLSGELARDLRDAGSDLAGFDRRERRSAQDSDKPRPWDAAQEETVDESPLPGLGGTLINAVA